MGNDTTKAPAQQAAPAYDAPEADLVAESGGTMDAPVTEAPASAPAVAKGPRVETHGGVRWLIFK